MRFTITCRKGAAATPCVRIGNWHTRFPQLAGLVPPGTYEARTASDGKKVAFLHLRKATDAIRRPFDMVNYMIDMGSFHSFLGYCTHIALCAEALDALFPGSVPEDIYIYRVREPRKKN